MCERVLLQCESICIFVERVCVYCIQPSTYLCVSIHVCVVAAYPLFRYATLFLRPTRITFGPNGPKATSKLSKGADVKLLRHYVWDIAVAFIVAVLLSYFLGISVLPLFLLLVIVEITFSGDNAVVNVELLKLLSTRWKWVFMTVGIAFAAGFMRFVFPILIVSITGNMGFGDAVHLAFTDHAAYAEHVEAAHPQIAVFGGVYLFMIAATFFLVENNNGVHWFPWLERKLAFAGNKIQNIAPIITTIIVLVLSVTIDAEYQKAVLLAGMISLVSYMVIKGMSDAAGNAEHGTAKRTGWRAFGIFIALEFQDMAFSFDGVSGALAITQDPLVIMGGLGVGALFVRSATMHLLARMEDEESTELRYLSHGAYYAILVLAASQILSLFFEIPGWLVGLISVVLIFSAVFHSHILNKRDEKTRPAGEENDEESTVEKLMGVDLDARR